MKKKFVNPYALFLLVILSALSFTGCKKNATTENPIVIGKEYEGGTIFYIDNTGKHGMVVTKLNPEVTTQWGCYWTDIPSTSAAFGAGKTNTLAILANCSETNAIARICDNLTTGGFTDWYMPSKDELHLIYTNLHLIGLGGFENHSYWSSTEHTPHYGWELNFGTGIPDRGSKGNNYQKGLAVRDF